MALTFTDDPVEANVTAVKAVHINEIRTILKDHVEAGGTEHSLATSESAGFMSAADKSIINSLSAGSSGVISVTGVSPVTVSTSSPYSAANPGISVADATQSTSGLMSAADKTKLDGLENAGEITATTPISISESNVISIAAATTTTPGSLSAADKTKLDQLSVTVGSALEKNTIVMWYGDPTGLFDATGKGIAGTSMANWALCVTGDTEVSLSDGSKKTIAEIVNNKLEVNVISWDKEANSFTTNKVVDWFKNEFNEDDFYRISFMGKCDTSSITATKDHPFLTTSGWKTPEELKSRDNIFIYKDRLSDVGEKALLGMYLGDGSIDNGFVFSCTHGMPQEEYAEYISKKFNVNTFKQLSESGYGTGKENIRYKISIMSKIDTLKPALEESIRLKMKARPDILNRLGAVGLAFWYMDDGTLVRDHRYPNYFRAELQTQEFNREERDNIEDYFIKTWNIKGTFYKCTNCDGYKFRLDEASSKIFFTITAPYIINSLKYKLPEDYRHQKCILDLYDFIITEKVLVNVRVKKLSEMSKTARFRIDRSARYDIKIENTHSFVANGFIVHNCNGNNGSPNLVDKFPVGAGNLYAKGATGGAATVTLTTDQIPAHTHSMPTTEQLAGSLMLTARLPAATNTGSFITGSVGGGQSHNNMPPYVGVYYIMKLDNSIYESVQIVSGDVSLSFSPLVKMNTVNRTMSSATPYIRILQYSLTGCEYIDATLGNSGISWQSSWVTPPSVPTRTWNFYKNYDDLVANKDLSTYTDKTIRLYNTGSAETFAVAAYVKLAITPSVTMSADNIVGNRFSVTPIGPQYVMNQVYLGNLSSVYLKDILFC